MHTPNVHIMKQRRKLPANPATIMIMEADSKPNKKEDLNKPL